eukprot:Skav230346  [mRNA]  locus=scaffold25:141106:142296:- [translate_table: standard]
MVSWNFSHYPWHFVKSSGIGTWRRDVLYGTAFAQKTIWEHQHPADCNGAKYLEYYNRHSGMGSQLHLLGQALALAMHLGRVLILPEKDKKMMFYDPSFCPGEVSWHCWFQHITWCKRPRHAANDQILRMRGEKVHMADFTTSDVPEIFRNLLSNCSPMKPQFWYYWWRAQSVTYFIRFNEKTRSALDQMRSQTLHECQKPLQPGAVLETGTVSAHVRHGKKTKEAEVFDFSAYREQMEHLAAGNQNLPVLRLPAADSNHTFNYPNNAYAKRTLFLSTEDPEVVPQALQLCSAMQPWKVIYTDVKRVAKDNWMKLGSPKPVNLPARAETLVALMNLELALEADAWVCTLTSNWCRLIDELRMTVAMKASHPYLNLAGEGFVCKGKPPHQHPYCYLGW